MAITREEVERMEEQAGLSRRFNAASDDYVARNNPRLRAMERESVLRTAEADVYNKARQRRIDSQRLVAIADPGRFSPFERNSLLGIDKNGGALIDRQERAGLRAHELDVLKQQGDNDFRVAEQKRFGMREQGSDAAGLNAEATKYGWDQQLEMEKKRQNGLTEREKMIGERTERIAGMEHGTVGPDGKITPGSRERVATITGQSAVQQQAEANKGLFARAEIDRQKQERDIAGRLQNTVLKNGAKLNEAQIKSFSGIISKAISSGALVGDDAETSLSKLAKANQNNPELIEAISAFSGNGQPPKNAPSPSATKIPGYSQSRIEELQKRGYAYKDGKWAKVK